MEVLYFLVYAGGQDLTSHYPNSSSSADSLLPVREVRMFGCRLKLLWRTWSDCFGEHGLLSLLSFLKSPSVSGDISKALVTDTVMVNVLGASTQSTMPWLRIPEIESADLLRSLAIYPTYFYFLKHLLTMLS